MSMASMTGYVKPRTAGICVGPASTGTWMKSGHSLRFFFPFKNKAIVSGYKIKLDSIVCNESQISILTATLNCLKGPRV